MMEDEDRRKKIITAIIAIFSAIILLIIVAVVVAINNTPRTDFPDIDDGPGEEIYEKSLVFYNRDFLTMAYNIDFSAIVLDEIKAVVFSDEEMKFSRDNNSKEYSNEIYYDATIDIGDFSSYADYRNGFDVEISDNRTYKVITKTDSLNEDFTYVYSALLREGGDKIFVMINGAENDKDAFIEFAKQKLGKDKVEVAVLNEIEN